MRTPLLLLLAPALLPGCRAPLPGPARLAYPDTPRVDAVDEYHGVAVPDPYRWLEDAQAPETRAWVEEQNALTRDYLDGPGREALRARLETLWSYERLDLPVRRGGRTFYRRNDGDRNQNVLFVADGDVASGGAVVLDPNTLSTDGTLALLDVHPSRDGRLVACGLSDGGSDWRLWEVRDATTGARLPDEITGNKFGGLRWAANGAGFYYPRTDRPAPGQELVARNSPPDLVYHALGTDEAADRIVLARPEDPGLTQGFEIGSDGRSLFALRFEARTRHNEILRVPLDPATGLATGPAEKLVAGFDARFRYVGDDGRTVWVLTDLDAPRWRIVAIDMQAPGRERWREVVPEREDAIQQAEGYGRHLVVSYLRDASARLVVYDREGAPVREVALPGPGSVRGFSGNWDDPVFFYTFESFVQAPSVYRHDLASGDTRTVHVPELAFDASPFVTRQFFCTSADGTQVPLFVTHRRELELDGEHPTYLFGYGGFNVSLSPFFSPAHLVWLELGGVLAVANLRGGGEYGDAWHRAGTKLRKQNVFDDFIAAAEWLIAEGYTRPERLAIGGRSNGGLLVGACLTQRPELFGAALPVVGVHDMLRYHLFTIGWAWAGDYGTVDDQEEFRALLAYSPLHNARPGRRYPATFLTTGDRDDRVVPAHSYKLAAALQEAQAGDAPVLLRVETRAGHGRGKPIAMQIEEAADRWTFVMNHFGLTPRLP